MLQLTELQLGYLTGIIAGEGMIGLINAGGGVVPTVKVSNTEPAMLYDLRNMTGLGSVRLDIAQRRANHRRTQQWEVQGRQVVPLLDMIIPTLDLFNSAKAEQGRIVRAYTIMYLRDRRNSLKGVTKKLCPCEVALRQSYKERASSLKTQTYMCNL